MKNGMTNITEEKIMQADKLITLGTLVSGIVHEISNPNNIILLNSEILATVWQDTFPILEQYYESNGDFLLGGVPYSQYQKMIGKYIDDIMTGGQRIKDIIMQLHKFTRAEPGEMADKIDINEIVKSALGLLSYQLRKSTQHVETFYELNLPQIHGNAQQLQQVVVNLLMNSLQALKSSSDMISITTSTLEEKQFVQILIEDQGVGISPENLSKIQQPFFTTRSDMNHLGLGLTICSRIIHRHQGNLDIASEIGKGTRVTIKLPVKPMEFDTGQEVKP